MHTTTWAELPKWKSKRASIVNQFPRSDAEAASSLSFISSCIHKIRTSLQTTRSLPRLDNFQTVFSRSKVITTPIQYLATFRINIDLPSPHFDTSRIDANLLDVSCEFRRVTLYSINGSAHWEYFSVPAILKKKKYS